MNTATASSRSIAFSLLVFALLCALPLGLARAQDYKAVERKLGEAVAEGDLSLAQAAAMMTALKKTGEGDIQHRFGEWIGSVGGKLKEAVAAGKFSEADAWKKWQHFKEHELAPKLKAAVNSGQLSEAAGWSIWKHVEKAEAAEKGAGKGKGDKPDWDAIKKKIEGAVKAGKITREQADEKYEAIKQQMSGEHGKGSKHEQAREYLMKVRKKLGEAVEAGKISEEDAKRKYQAVEKALKEKMRAGQGKKDAYKDLEAAGQKIRAAIEAGEITKEQGRAKMEAYKKNLREKDRR